MSNPPTEELARHLEIEYQRAHEALDAAGIERESADDEMPPGVLLTVAERIARLARLVSR